MSLFGPPNVGKLRAKGDVAGLIKALAYPKDDQVRNAALLALREVALDTGDLQATGALLGAAEDPALSLPAIHALGELARRRGEAQALDRLVAKASGSRDRVRSAAIRAVAKVAATAGREDLRSQASEGLLPLLDYPDADPEGWVLAAESLGNCADRRATARLLDALEHPLPEIRCAAAQALGHMVEPRAVEPLIALLSRPDRATRVAGAQALVRMYNVALLSETQKQRILHQRAIITWGHEDREVHVDKGTRITWRGSSDCIEPHQDRRERVDKGIGVAFPL